MVGYRLFTPASAVNELVRARAGCLPHPRARRGVVLLRAHHSLPEALVEAIDRGLAISRVAGGAFGVHGNCARPGCGHRALILVPWRPTLLRRRSLHEQPYLDRP
jgi:hypothetical protein